MKTALCLLMVSLAAQTSAASAPADSARWEAHAKRTSIVRDNWGIAHVRGKTDADAVFGMIYAQAEDDFNRVETNYLNSMGRLAEAEGESAIYKDLRMKLFIDPADMQARYAASPKWLQVLMTAWADGLNYYLHTHKDVKPRVIGHFEPWMALTFSEGSIGGDIERVSLSQLEAFYGKRRVAMLADEDPRVFREPRGSNGFAIAPAITADRHAMLLINPHTSFFFRSELQMTSDEGLNAYGAATWGQFFIYQGFNDRLGWMHTSSGVDVVDEFLETVDDSKRYKYGNEWRPLQAVKIEVPYRTSDGKLATRSFTVYKTHRGPIVREVDGKWVSIALMHRPSEALQQSFLRTKARDYKSYLKVTELQANSSNNTIYADVDGNIAYLHPQFVPKRDDRFDYTKPVDGSDPATDWQGLHKLDDLPSVFNPGNGWIMNTNNWPYSAAAEYSPKREKFARYMDSVGENPRGLHAIRVLENKKDFTLSSLLSAAYDPYLTAFSRLIPTLVRAYDGLPADQPLRSELKEQIDLLRQWDYLWSVDSSATSLAVFWGETLWKEVADKAQDAGISIYDYMAERASSEQKLQALLSASKRLAGDFGNWRTPWGQINRFQRLTGDIVQPFNDAAPSVAVPFTSAQWGSLASFGAKPYPGTKRYYGTSGNSFVAVVEFGDKVRARAISAGGESGDPKSPHFYDQVDRYSRGDLRDVYFYPSDLQPHIKRTYHPGK
ncbi:penicillin acylase family protein [Peristeroidobacter soli]|uniref:penicillin acylase family protein n=1 Tax=Peristeroidobacter soli TaxID=2497877 RepID=UPI00101D5325|nr:penicillin acylase family protein [Peristeroidobacter soli]